MYSVLSTIVKMDTAPRLKARKAGIRPALRWEVFARDGYRCVYCGRKPPSVALEADHKVSEAEGGMTELENLVTACEECNRGKGSRSVR
jgi:5-methylcytosine-specific restriction endonuclease McrA